MKKLEDDGSKTLVPAKNFEGNDTMITHADETTDCGLMVELESNLGTMVINSDESTMKREFLSCTNHVQNYST